MDTSTPYHVNERVHRPSKTLLADNMAAQRAHPHVIKDMQTMAWWNVRKRGQNTQPSGFAIRPLAQCNKILHFKRTQSNPPHIMHIDAAINQCPHVPMKAAPERAVNPN